MSKSRFNWNRVLFLAAFSARLYAQQLAIEEAVISDFEGGFGVPLTYEFSPTQKVHLAFRIRGFQAAPTEQPRYRQATLTYTVEAVDCSGRLLAPAHSGQVDKRLLADRDRNWAPVVPYEVQIPPTPRAGAHSFRIRVQDKVSGATAALEVQFEVQSPFDDPAQDLAIERYRFYASERAERPIDGTPVFRPGESIWGRFLLSGFRTDAANKFDLQYGVSVRNPAGRTLFNTPKAAAESKESFYPKTHVPGMIHVVLGRSIRPGSYFLVLSAADAMGKQQVKAEYPFRVTE